MSTPLFVDLRGRRVVGIGAGPVAAAKLLPLAAGGAEIVLVAPASVPELRTAPGVTWRRRAYAGPGDLAGAVLVVAATAEAATDGRVAADADTVGVLCVRVDGGGSAAFGAAVRHGPLTIAVGTEGRAPAVARHVRRALADAYGPEWGTLASIVGEVRADPRVRALLAGVGAAETRRRWRTLDLDHILALIRLGVPEQAKEAVAACLSSSSD